MVSIYNPAVKREAELHGITDLQAYRRINAREEVLRRASEQRRADAAAGRGIYK